MRYKIVEEMPNASADEASRRAAELASELGAIMAPAGAMLYLAEFALACVVANRADRASFEEYLGESVPDGLWRELEAMAETTDKVDLSDLAGPEASDRHDMLAVLALGCVCAGEGSRKLLDQRLGTPLSENDWSKLEQEIADNLPKLKKTWRQMRDHGMMTVPESLFGMGVDTHAE